MNFGEAYEAYSRAKDLAPHDSHIAYFFGIFLVNAGIDPREGLTELQRAASLDSRSSAIQLGIIDAHLNLADARGAMDAAAYALEHVSDGLSSQSVAAFKLLSASAGSAVAASREEDWAKAAEDIEFAVDAIGELGPEVFTRESLDICLLLADLASLGEHGIGRRLYRR